MNGVITAVDRYAGTFTVSDVGAFFDAKKAEVDRLYESFADAMSSYMFNNAGGDLVSFEPGMTITVSPSMASALECGVTAAVVLGGLGWLIARRNALASNPDYSKSWVEEVAAWLVELIRGLFSRPQLPAHTEDT